MIIFNFSNFSYSFIIDKNYTALYLVISLQEVKIIICIDEICNENKENKSIKANERKKSNICAPFDFISDF